MAVTVEYGSYSELCEKYVYGKNFLDLPATIIDRLDEYMDGQHFGSYDGPNPDNLWVNAHTSFTPYEVLVDMYGLLTPDEFEEMTSDEINTFIDENESDIEMKLYDDYTYLLGLSKDDDEWVWHVLQ